MDLRRVSVAAAVIAIAAISCRDTVKVEKQPGDEASEPIAQQSSAILPANNCMQDLWAQAGNSQNLQCTSNDVSIASASNIRDLNGKPLDKCDAGIPFSFIADFKVVLTAQTRYDLGLYFASDGDPNGDGALTGSCSESVIRPKDPLTGLGSANFVNLDPAPDTCGDITSAKNPQIVTVEVDNVMCKDSGNGMLALPNCTSWREPGANGVCQGPSDAFPGSPSKCNCDKAFTLPIFVETGSISVTKTPNPTSLPEPGGAFTYTVVVKNTSTVTSVTINSLCDDQYGTIVGAGCPAGKIGSITSTTCTVPFTLAAQQSSTPCTFTANLKSNDPTTLTDTVTAAGQDQNGKSVSATGSAQVAITDSPPAATIVKSLDSLQCSIVRYDVDVKNTSAVDALNLSALTDNGFGDITKVQGNVIATTCSVTNNSIAVGATYHCTFDGKFCGGTHTNAITGTLDDGEGNTIMPNSNTLTVNTSAVLGP